MARYWWVPAHSLRHCWVRQRQRPTVWVLSEVNITEVSWWWKWHLAHIINSIHPSGRSMTGCPGMKRMWIRILQTRIAVLCLHWTAIKFYLMCWVLFRSRPISVNCRKKCRFYLWREVMILLDISVRTCRRFAGYTGKQAWKLSKWRFIPATDMKYSMNLIMNRYRWTYFPL